MLAMSDREDSARVFRVSRGGHSLSASARCSRELQALALRRPRQRREAARRRSPRRAASARGRRLSSQRAEIEPARRGEALQRLAQHLAALAEGGERQRGQRRRRRKASGVARGISSTTLDVTFGGGVKAAGGTSNRMRVSAAPAGEHAEAAVVGALRGRRDDALGDLALEHQRQPVEARRPGLGSPASRPAAASRCCRAGWRRRAAARLRARATSSRDRRRARRRRRSPAVPANARRSRPARRGSARRARSRSPFRRPRRAARASGRRGRGRPR